MDAGNEKINNKKEMLSEEDAEEVSWQVAYKIKVWVQYVGTPCVAVST